MAAFNIFGKQAAEIFISTRESSNCLFLLLFTYGMSSLPLSYLYSMTFENHSTAQISIMAINFLTGFIAVLAYYILISVPDTKYIGVGIVHFFRFFPPYNIGEGLINLSSAYYRTKVLNETTNYLAWDITGRNIVFIRAGHWVERQRALLVGAPPGMKHAEDQDVQAERDRVDAMDLSEKDAEEQVSPDLQHNALIMRNLVKIYPPSVLGGEPKHAVRGVSLACPLGERFGLLGINGAGKTSILSILTGDLQPTSGEVYIGGRSLSDPITKRMIGYCPQVDPLLDLMNGYETLWFFGRIRGIPTDVLQQRVEALINEVGLQNFAAKPCGTYSGGNKRK
eukprot:gene26027-32552_t